MGLGFRVYVHGCFRKPPSKLRGYVRILVNDVMFRLQATEDYATSYGCQAWVVTIMLLFGSSSC